MTTGRRTTDTRLTSGETIKRLTEVATAFKVEVVDLAWAVEYINGETEKLALNGPEGSPCCTFGDCKRNAMLIIDGTNIYRCSYHSWFDETTNGWAVQSVGIDRAALYNRDSLTFFR